ncbi:hypothetical protein LOS15_11195 [Halomonas sp. 7T]|uniref:hypothetical protein n=1 Tax=Halomonas sp. 7T TaxID=2893469 RepID=UPI0021D85CC6|nr:hypothetical protein [Halomonas sp. 7T]UXZ53402.1 hypothetical protein LOS15_11195 [Halomonas sp. 7T]
MKIFTKILIYMAFLFCLFIIFHTVDFDYEYSELKEYMESLLTVSAMVFTIMGIWIAFLYPNALSKIVNPKKVEYADFNDSLNETRRLEGLVASVLKSAFVVTAVVLIFLGELVFGFFLIDSEYFLNIKQLAVSLVIVLTFLQLESVFYVMYSNVMFINELHTKREEREADNDV